MAREPSRRPQRRRPAANGVSGRPGAELFAFLEQRQVQRATDALVRLAAELRAGRVCEYCLRPSTDAFHVDHIIPSRHWEAFRAGELPLHPSHTPRRGPHHLDNYAWSCARCNLAKGGALSGRIGTESARLYDPRIDHWPEHFAFFHQYLMIKGVSRTGIATERRLGFNDARLGGPVGTRHDLILTGQYPPPWARAWLGDLEQR